MAAKRLTRGWRWTAAGLVAVAAGARSGEITITLPAPEEVERAVDDLQNRFAPEKQDSGLLTGVAIGAGLVVLGGFGAWILVRRGKK